MRKDQTIFFVAGLAFGVLIGYFLSVRLAPSPASSPPAASAPAAARVDESRVRTLERQAAERPDDPAPLFELGNLFMDAGAWDRAIPYLEKAVRLAPDDLHARNHLALCYENVGRVDDAVREYEAVLAVDANHPPSLLGLGRVRLYRLRDIRGGLEAWERLVRVAPDSPEAARIREELEALKAAHTQGGA